MSLSWDQALVNKFCWADWWCLFYELISWMLLGISALPHCTNLLLNSKLNKSKKKSGLAFLEMWAATVGQGAKRQVLRYAYQKSQSAACCVVPPNQKRVGLIFPPLLLGKGVFRWVWKALANLLSIQASSLPSVYAPAAHDRKHVCSQFDLHS